MLRHGLFSPHPKLLPGASGSGTPHAHGVNGHATNGVDGAPREHHLARLERVYEERVDNEYIDNDEERDHQGRARHADKVRTPLGWAAACGWDWAYDGARVE